MNRGDDTESIGGDAVDLVRAALMGRRGQPRNKAAPVVEIHIAERLTPSFARQIVDLQLDLLEQFGLATTPSYLRNACIILGLEVKATDGKSSVQAFNALKDNSAKTFIARHRINKIVMKNLDLPLPPNVNPTGREHGICSRILAYS